MQEEVAWYSIIFAACLKQLTNMRESKLRLSSGQGLQIHIYVESTYHLASAAIIHISHDNSILDCCSVDKDHPTQGI